MNLISIGGSDPSSGAGIQSDVKTFDSLNAYGLTVITAITSQNTTKFGMVQPATKKILDDQLNSLFSDFKIDGIKIGMVYNSEIIKTIHSHLKELTIPIIIDPVIKSTTGGILLQKEAISDFKKYLIPLAKVITPNKFEAEIISNKKITSKKDLERAAENILNMNVEGVIVTGLEFEKNRISDFIKTKTIQEYITDKKIDKINHGSGCNYSASMLVGLVKGKPIQECALFSHKFTLNSIKGSQKIGKGVAITKIKKDEMYFELSKAINQFTQIKNISDRIPECQTNFVFSKKNPRSEKDVLGISGRVVKTGSSVIQAGELKYGSSRHVAKAVLTINEKYPQIRSGINLKLEKETLTKLKKNGFKIKEYDRTKEPKIVKTKEGSSIQWGINEALKGTNSPPDAIYHKGDFGKEPMILIFGKSPSEVIEKIAELFL